jgi:hypothetical protein
VLSGPQATHRAACHNQPTAGEAAAGHPLRSGFVPAPPPAGLAGSIDAQSDAVAAYSAEEAR